MHYVFILFLFSRVIGFMNHMSVILFLFLFFFVNFQDFFYDMFDKNEMFDLDMYKLPLE